MVLERKMALRVQRNLFVADQSDRGVCGGGTGSRRGGFFHPLGMHIGDPKKQTHRHKEKKRQVLCHNRTLTTSGNISRAYL